MLMYAFPCIFHGLGEVYDFLRGISGGESVANFAASRRKTVGFVNYFA